MSRFMSSPLPDEELTPIKGNAPRSAKEWAVKWYFLFRSKDMDYGHAMADAELKVTEVEVQGHVDDPEQKEVRMVSEVEVIPGMCDGHGILSQGCMALIIDEGSAIALLVHNVLQGAPNIIGVSQSINIMFHASAPVGTKLRIISRSVTAGGTLDTCRCEIWDNDKHKLIASGVQNQAQRSRL
ncbi:hypothetical protein FA15DRAFT_583394 [Coprinopsis marcescibilis]|uniref:Thioesterase domain-containing protein n=1 Tax=Coprinopsis marcescibilis TaxID=230819 RepID=A0A5C3L7G8_COPMA|nr:hypothetical protein FA15DRAFT_583394 [Coprinopsis marcescibilis]